MDWTLFYEAGAAVTAAIAVYTLFQMDLTERECIELGVIFLFGLVMWPGLLYGLIALNFMLKNDQKA